MVRAGIARSAADIARLRLRNQRLVGAPFATPEEVVGWLGVVQSQDFYGAKWALAQRTQRANDAEIEAAFERGSILRTHVLRPTWHFVLPDDLRWMLELTAPRVRMLMAYYDRKLEIDAALLGRSRAVFERVLRGTARTREELAAALAAEGIRASGQRLGHIVSHAELDAVICSGPRRGKRFTYALLDERAPAAGARRSREEALVELAKRYFASHGPALVQDFAWWSGLTITDGKRALELLGKAVEQVVVDDKTFWFLPPVAGARVRFDPPVVHLLPNYDECVASFKDYESSFDAARVKVPRNAEGALMNNILVSNGQIVGGWKRTLAKDRVELEVKLLTRLSEAEREALQCAAERYGEYLGLRVQLKTTLVKSLARMA